MASDIVGGLPTNPYDVPDPQRIASILAGLRRFFMPPPGPDVRQTPPPLLTAEERGPGAPAPVDPGYSAPQLADQVDPNTGVPYVHGRLLTQAERLAPLTEAAAQEAQALGLPPALLAARRAQAAPSVASPQISVESPESFAGSISQVKPEDPEQALRDLGLASREFQGPGGSRMFTNRSDAELAQPGGEQFAEGAGGRISVGNPAALRGGFAFGGNRYGGAITPQDLTAAEARGTAAAGAEGRAQAAERDLRMAMHQRTELIRRFQGAPPPDTLAAVDAQVKHAQDSLQMAAAEGLPAAQRAQKLAEIGRATAEAGAAPTSREQFDVKTRLEYDKLANDVLKASLAGPETAQATGAAHIEGIRIQQEGAAALKAIEEKWRLAGMDKDTASNLAKDLPNLLAFFPADMRQRAAGSVLMALERAFGRLPGAPPGGAALDPALAATIQKDWASQKRSGKPAEGTPYRRQAGGPVLAVYRNGQWGPP